MRVQIIQYISLVYHPRKKSESKDAIMRCNVRHIYSNDDEINRNITQPLKVTVKTDSNQGPYVNPSVCVQQYFTVLTMTPKKLITLILM